MRMFIDEMVSRITDVIDDYDLTEFEDASAFAEQLSADDITGNLSGNCGLDNAEELCIENMADVVRVFRDLDSINMLVQYLDAGDYNSIAIWMLEDAIYAATYEACDKKGKSWD